MHALQCGFNYNESIQQSDGNSFHPFFRFSLKRLLDTEDEKDGYRLYNFTAKNEHVNYFRSTTDHKIGIVFDFSERGVEVAENGVNFGDDNVPLILSDCRELIGIAIATVAIYDARRLRELVIGF